MFGNILFSTLQTTTGGSSNSILLTFLGGAITGGLLASGIIYEKFVVYGKEEWERRNKSNYSGLPISVAFVVWILCLLFSFLDNSDAIIARILAVIIPAAVILYTVLTKRRIKREREEFLKQEKLQSTAAEALQNCESTARETNDTEK